MSLKNKLWIDLKTDAERSAWLLLGRGVETGVIAPALQAELSMVFSHREQLRAENAALRASGDELAEILTDTGNPEDDRPTVDSAMDAIARWRQAALAAGGAK